MLDKNGKEIYLNNYVRCNNGKIYRVFEIYASSLLLIQDLSGKKFYIGSQYAELLLEQETILHLLKYGILYD
jgi:hypothetical protein